MIIRPKTKAGIALNCHPVGIGEFVNEQIQYVKQHGSYTGVRNVLIVGGSTGYGLASAISLLYGANANVLSLSYETPPTGKKTGNSGFWNIQHLTSYARKDNLHFHNIQGDAFSFEMKEAAVEYIQNTFGKIDLFIYSLAAPKRYDEKTETLYTSVLKPINTDVSGYSLGIQKDSISLEHLSIPAATEDEINQTIRVMGGEDFYDWHVFLKENNVLEEQFKSVNYSYIGSDITYDIYYNGTIGAAKKNLLEYTNKINAELFHGASVAHVVVDKAIVSRASAVIPVLSVYVGTVFKVMKEQGVHETTIAHKHRFFKDMLYGNTPVLDEQEQYRPDAYELLESVQEETKKRLATLTEENYMSIIDGEGILEDFNHMNGFGYDTINYDEDISIEDYLTMLQNT